METMETTDKYRKPFFFVLSTLIMLVVLFIIFLSKTSQNANKGHLNEIHTDTVVLVDTQFIEVPVEKIKYRDRKVVDTVYLTTPQDTTPLPIEQKHYNDSIADIYISGFQPNIDSINYHIPKQTIYVDKVVEIEKPKSFWENRFVITAGFGVHYGLVNKQYDIGPYVGVGIRLY